MDTNAMVGDRVQRAGHRSGVYPPVLHNQPDGDAVLIPLRE